MIRVILAVWSLVAFGVTAGFALGGDDVRGLPFIRPYPLDEIGKVPRGARLGFDANGRFAVMYDGIYTVLNDTVWIDRIDPAPENRTLMSTVRAVNGVYYYGGRATWGIADQTEEGYLRPRSLVPPDAPAWTALTPFSEMLVTEDGVYFYELNGVVYWDFAKRQNSYFELTRLTTCFRVGRRVFVSAEDRQLREILRNDDKLRPLSIPGLDGAVVIRSAPLDEHHTLLGLQDGRLLLFDGHEALPWLPQQSEGLGQRIQSITRLADGGVAVGVRNKGIYLFAVDGSLRWRLPLPEFNQISAMAANEPGVLWAMGENSIYKIYYESPISSFGPTLGLAVSWPRLVNWNNRLLVSSGRTLYTSVANGAGAPSSFQVMPGLAEGTVGAIAAKGEHLLVADKDGVYAADRDCKFIKVLDLYNTAKLVAYADDTFIAIGSRQIAAIRFVDGNWIECAPRIPGVGETPVRTFMRRHLWIEMGGDKVAQLALNDGVMRLDRVTLPWKGEQWTNIGAVGSTIILSSAQGSRTYFDELQQSFVEAPKLDALLNRSPFWIARVVEDDRGTLWATHTRGVVTFRPNSVGYDMDAATYELRNDSYPEVMILPDRSVWLSSGRSLYRVEHGGVDHTEPLELQLVSLVVDDGGRELVDARAKRPSGLRFAHDNNNISFRFFSGTYAWRSPPLYEYRLGEAENWTTIDGGALIHFPKLRDGEYRLEVRSPGADHRSSAFTLPFVIAPPWYRSPWALSIGAVMILLGLAGVVRWSNDRSIRRNAELERLVRDRTRKLEDTMSRLNEETRNAATLAERTRLAGEIHDSLQQGLSGSLLHLETTLSQRDLAPNVRAQLGIMRNMLSYTREEVQQAVWNLESPLLQNTTLSGALTALVEYLHPGSGRIQLSITDEAVPLSADTQHNLLRIAQEAITNAVKHAAAKNIMICLKKDEGHVVLSVSDDGCGFDMERQRKIDGHFGLRGIQIRGRSIGGQVHIESKPNAGTSIQVTVPLQTPLRS